MDATDANIWDWNLATDEIYFSPNWYRILGYEPGGFPSDPAGVRGFIHPDDLPLVDESSRRAVGGSSTGIVEFRVRAADGTWRWFSGLGRVSARDAAGRPVRMSGTNRDITERRRAQRAILLSEARLLATLENTPNVAVQWYDDEGRVRYWNKASEQFYGWTSAEALGRTLDHLIHTPGEAAEFLRILKEIQRTGEPYGPWESSIRRRDGRTGWVLATTFGIPMDEDRTGFVCMDVDITGLKQAEEALRESEERFRSLAETAFEGVMIHDNGVLLEANAQFARVFGYDSPSELIGRNVIDLLLTPESRDAIRQRIAEGASLGAIGMAEVTGVRRDGTTFLGETQSCATTFRGRPARVVAMRDITERRHMEERLRQAEKLEAVGQLAGGVAHDFNNMLNVILGHAEMAAKFAGTNPELARNLRGIEQAARRSAELTGQLLAFARKQTITPKAVELNGAVDAMMDLLRRLIHEGIEIEWSPGAEPCPIRIDPQQLVQILANLMVNARDAIGHIGRVAIRTGTERIDDASPDATPGEYVCLEVVDDGCGMDERTRAHLFEPFYTTKPVGQGTGLGLATVYGIVRQNGGFITVDSEPGRGSTFRIHLPVYHGEFGEERPRPVVGPPRGGSETILLVEDEPMVLDITKTVLDSLGYRVFAASSPDEALRIAKDELAEIDLLITDIMMPGMSGCDLAERLAGVHPGLRKLYISGYTADYIAPGGVLSEDVHFIQKPYPLNDLAARVREALGKGAGDS